MGTLRARGGYRLTSDQATNSDQAELEEETGGYPDLSDIFGRLLDAEDLPKQGVRRVEVNVFASGEATCKVLRWDAEEPEGAYLPPR
jgi:hypothetical protein